MPKYVKTVGQQNLSIAVCDRCGFKYPYSELRADGDKPGLRVCKKCYDTRDPYKLPVPPVEVITLRYPRPDIDLD